jgi:dsDNA-binding SOS-regulon protein
MADIPQGLTVDNNLKTMNVMLGLTEAIANSSEDQKKIFEGIQSNFQKTTKEYNELLSSVEEQTKILASQGGPGAKKAAEQFAMSMAPLLEKETEKFTEEIQGYQSDVSRYMESNKFTNAKDLAVAENLNQLMSEEVEFLKEDSKERASLFEALGEKISGPLKNVMGNAFDTMLGPLQLVTKPLEELTGMSLQGGIGSLFNWGKDKLSGGDEPEKEKRIQPKRTSLLKYGIEGASAVYLGDLLLDKNDQESEEMDGLLKKFGTIAAIAAPALLGIAAFTALKWDDFKDGFAQLKDGKIFKGIESLLIGNRDDITEENAGKGIGKQTAAWGLGALGVGTTASAVGAVSAAGGVAAAGGIGSVMGSALVAAFPPALIAAAAAGMAKGVQTAYKLEWDKKSEEAVNHTREIFRAEESNWWDKTKASIGLYGKALFGTLAGGLRSVVEPAREQLSSIWADEEDGVVKKVVKSGGAAIKTLVAAPFQFFSGYYSTLKDYMWNILPQGLKDGITKQLDKLKAFTAPVTNFIDNGKELLTSFVEDPFGNLQKGWDKFKKTKMGKFLSGTLQTVWGFARGIFSSVTDSISAFFKRIKDKIAETAIGGAIFDFAAKTKEIFDHIVTGITDFFGGITDAAGGLKSIADEKLLEVKASIGDLFTGMTQSLKDFFGGIGTGFKDFFGIGDPDKGLLDGAKGLISRDKDGEPSIEDDKAGFFRSLFGMGTSPDAVVEDAIVTKQGQIIQTSPDDNIIATKTDPRVVESSMDREVSREVSKTYSSTVADSSEKFDKLIELTQVLVEETSKNKVSVNMAENSNYDFNKLRMGA